MSFGMRNLRTFWFAASLSGGESARAAPAQCEVIRHLPFLADGAHLPSGFGGLRQGIRKKGTREGPLLAGRQERAGWQRCEAVSSNGASWLALAVRVSNGAS